MVLQQFPLTHRLPQQKSAALALQVVSLVGQEAFTHLPVETLQTVFAP